MIESIIIYYIVLRSKNTRKRLTASIIVRKKIHGGVETDISSDRATLRASMRRYFGTSDRVVCQHRERERRSRSIGISQFSKRFLIDRADRIP